MTKEINNNRAKAAYDFVASISEFKTTNLPKEFCTLARSFPSMIQINGLGAAVAFLYSKKNKDNAHNKIYENLQNWLIQQDLIAIKESEELMGVLTNCSSDEYRLISREVMAYLQWVKRFAEGMLKTDG